MITSMQFRVWPFGEADLSIYTTVLANGYFPKELPPAFNTESFAAFASSRAGRDTIRAYATSVATFFRVTGPGVWSTAC
jgi:hypothetical protein